MKYFLFAALGLCLLPGCQKGPEEPADIDQAGTALRSALETWKSGKSQKDLADQTPSVIMNEDNWREGDLLVDYKMDEGGALQGRQVVWWVRIKLRHKGGQEEDRRAKYVIDTTPRLVIVRDRFAS